MLNLLMPTDFTPASIKTIEQAVKNFTEDKVNLVLFHAFEMPTSDADLLDREPSSKLMTEAFRQACKQLKDDYSKEIGKIIVRSMHGSTKVAFRNFAEANDIDLIWYPDEYLYTKVHTRSVNPMPFINKAGIPFLKLTNKRKEPVYSNQNFVNLELATS